VIFILRHDIVIGEGSSRLGVFSRGLPLSLLDIFSQHERVRELDVPFVVCPLRWFFNLLGHGSFHFVPVLEDVFPFFGCFGLFMIGRVSSCFPKSHALLGLSFNFYLVLHPLLTIVYKVQQ
jgi:hypothetical protein